MSLFNRRLFTLALGALALLSVAARTAAVLLNRADNGFCHPQTLSTVSAILALAAFLLVLLYGISRHACPPSRMTYLTVHTYLPSGICAAAAIPLVIHLFDKYHTLTAGVIRYAGGTASTDYALYLPALLLSAVFIIVLILYFATVSLMENTMDRRRAVLGILGALFFAAYALYLYFDMDLPLNTPTKLYTQLACFGAALYLLTDVRISLGRALWGWHVIAAYSAMLLCLLASVPELFVMISDKVSFADSPEESVFFFAFALVAFGRLALLPFLPNDTVSPVAAAAFETATERE